MGGILLAVMPRRILIFMLGLLVAGPVLSTPAYPAGEPAAPRITVLSVDRSPLVGGVEVAVDGANFTDDVEVTLGDAVVDAVELESTARLRFIVPPMRFAGGRTLSIRNAAGVAQTKFHILAPRLSDLPDGFITSVGGGFPYVGDGGPATAPGVGLGPTGLAVDAGGNVFVSDGWNHRVRRIDASTGEITTYAGTGVRGFDGDGGPALAAELNYPRGLAIDTDGALLIADWSNFRVRRVDPVTRRIETLEIREFFQPIDVAVATDGTLLVSTYFNSDFPDGKVYRVDRPSGAVEIVPAGEPSYSGETGIASDGNGGILMCHDTYGLIARYDVGTRTTEVLVEYSEAAYGATEIIPDGPDHCIVANTSYWHVSRIAYATGESTLIAGADEPGSTEDGGPAVEARLEYPVSIASDDNGRLLIAEQLGSRVRRVDGAGNIFTVAGTGSNVPDETSGPATSANLPAEFIGVDGDGNVFLARSHRVLRIDAVSGELSIVAGTGEDGFGGDGGPATAALLSWPSGIAVDAGGHVYVADSGNRRVRRIDASTGIIETVAGGVSRPEGPADIPFALFDPTGVALDGHRRLYIVDRTTPARLMKLNLQNGRLTTVATFPSPFEAPYHIVVAPAGLVTVSSRSQIYRVDTGTSVVHVLAGDPEMPGSSGDGRPAREATVSPRGLVYTARGNLVLANNQYGALPFDVPSNALRIIMKRRKTIEFLAGEPDGFGQYSGDGGPLSAAHFRPAGLATDGAGNLYIADGGNGRIRVVRSVLDGL